MLGVLLGVAALVLGAGSAVLSYEQNRKAASQAEDAAIHQAEASEQEAKIVQERADREQELKFEQAKYEAQLARELANEKIRLAEENTRITKEQKDEQFDIYRASQLASMAAADLEISGSTMAVMNRTSQEHERDKAEVDRLFEQFKEVSLKEANLVAEGGKFEMGQFTTRSTAETGYAVDAREREASAFRHKANNYSSQRRNITYGLGLGLAGAGLKGYGTYKLAETSPAGAYGVLAS